MKMSGEKFSTDKEPAKVFVEEFEQLDSGKKLSPDVYNAGE
jgi:hypothetical protein